METVKETASAPVKEEKTLVEVKEEKPVEENEPTTKKPKLSYEEKIEMKKTRLAEKWNRRKWSPEEVEAHKKKLAEERARGEKAVKKEENEDDDEKRERTVKDATRSGRLR